MKRFKNINTKNNNGKNNNPKKLIYGFGVICLTAGLLGALKPLNSCIANANELSGNKVLNNKMLNNVLVTKEADVETSFDGYLNIGSVSKMYVVTCVMQLVDQGKVDLDAPVTEYIPEFKMADERYKKITVRMLMNHTSGLMGSVYGGIFLLNESSSEYHDELLEILSKESLKADPGEYNCYCNDGFTLLEILTEKVSGMTFTEYMDENIVKPLSLNHTGTMWNMDYSKQAPIYMNGNVRMDAEYGQAIGAGGITANAEDVCTFGSTFFTGDNTLLSDNSKELMAENNKTDISFENFGLGWDEVLKKDYENAGVKVISKGGDTFAQAASLVVAPDEKISVSVLSSGGSSGVDEDMALSILDVALEEQGIIVEHPKREVPKLLDTIPDEILAYEGLYADSQQTISITFPDKKYMQVSSVTATNPFEQQFMYAEGGEFVSMKGDVASGNAIPESPLSTMYFKEIDGMVYVIDPDSGFLLYKTSESDVDEKVQSAWDERCGNSYFLVSGSASDNNYLNSNNHMTLLTSPEAKGYVNGFVMKDENHAGYKTVLPGTGSRDLSNIRIENVDGKEYLYSEEFDCKYISKENIPVFDSTITSVKLTSGEASWYMIEGAKNEIIHLDIPEGAAVNVYDKFGNIRYSSHMVGFGDEVPLPEVGMIVFIGNDGSQVNVEKVK